MLLGCLLLAGCAPAQKAKGTPASDASFEASTPLVAPSASEVILEAAPKIPVLATYSTKFPPVDGRTVNITLAASKINGYVLEPHKIFSFNNVVGIRTAERGFVDAPVLLQGRRTAGLGGGVCLVSSTLYASAILGGLTIIERRPHSLVPKYIEPGYDATVTFPETCAVAGAPCEKIDLRIKNPYEVPVTIRTNITDIPKEITKELTVWLEGIPPYDDVEVIRDIKPTNHGGRRWVRSSSIRDANYKGMVQNAGAGYFVKTTVIYKREGQEPHEYK